MARHKHIPARGFGQRPRWRWVGLAAAAALTLPHCGPPTAQREATSTGDTPSTQTELASLDIPNCGDPRPWDSDGDGLSNAVERNNAGEGYHDFRLDRCEEDPSRAIGTWYEGHLEAGINLSDRGTGYLHNRGSDAVDTDDWGDLTLISCLEAAGRAFEETGLRINVNDLSRRQGRHFPPHRSHRNGLDADLRYVRRDGRNAPLDLRFHPEAYDLEATQELMRRLVELCPVEVIFVDSERLGFDNQALGRGQHVLRHASGHSNHFHLRLRGTP